MFSRHERSTQPHLKLISEEGMVFKHPEAAVATPAHFHKGTHTTLWNYVNVYKDCCFKCSSQA